MKSTKMWLLVILMLFPTINVIGADFSNERFQCLMNDTKFDVTAPMPADWTKKQKELTSKNLCNTWTEVIENKGKVIPTEQNEDDEQFNKEFLPFSDQNMMCQFDGTELLLTVPMPDNWTKKFREKTCITICNSIKKAAPMVIVIPGKKKEETPKEAVCDTDYNCEVLWEKYNKYDIAKIFTTSDNRQRPGVNVLEITCKNDPVIRYTATEAELVSICQSPISIFEAMEDNAKTKGESTEFTLNWYQLETAVEANMIPIDRTSDDSPTTQQFIDFMKQHPEAEIGGVYRNKQGAEKVCKMINQPSDENSECYKNNVGIQITDLTIRFGDSHEMPKWLTDFCKNSDNNSELGRGFWNCEW